MKFCLIFMILLLSNLGCPKFFNNMLEGDIAVRDDELGDVDTQDAFVRHASKKWAYNTVPYYIDESSIRSEDDREFIKEVIQDIQDSAKCIIFEDISDKEKKTGDHIKITAHGDDNNSGDGCWSYNGKQGGEQVINLAEECMEWGMIAHEVLHALGQVHEHNRPDRDSYVEINEDNVKSGKKKNFIKRQKGSGKDEVVFMDAKYDFYSLLHYPSTAWSKDEKSETITPINKQYKDIGGTGGMTATDIIELNLRYECIDIATPIVIDYVHEVEHRLEKEGLNMKEICKDKLNDLQQDITVKLEATFEAKLNAKLEKLEAQLEQEMERKLENLEKEMETKLENLKQEMEAKLQAKLEERKIDIKDKVKNLETKILNLILDPQCSKPFTMLSDKWRKVEYGVPHSTSHCDKTGWQTGWYSFKFGPSYATIPTTPPAEENRQSSKTCGTHASSWSSSSLPTIGQPPQDINIHFAHMSKEKYQGYSLSGKVVGCRGENGQGMYLYYLPPVPTCTLAYCGIL